VEEIGSIYESLLEFTPRISESQVEIEGRQIPANTFYLDPRGLGRKTSGSYYTPPSLVNELIKSALVPVMEDHIKAVVPDYDSELVEALTEEERKAAEGAILALNVVDPAAGSGAFLIAANNKLAQELARIRSGEYFPPEDVTRHARRDVLAHCIYAVDLNPMAVELCKVSLWINAAVEDAPLNFLDHHIRWGNSLVGASPELIKDGIPNNAYKPVTGDDKKYSAALKKQNRAELKGQMGLMRETTIKIQEDLQNWRRISQLAEDDPNQAEAVYYAYFGSDDYWEQRLPYDLWTAAFFAPIDKSQPIPTTQDVRQAQNDSDLVNGDVKVQAHHLAEQYHFFHWNLEFPEIYSEKDNDGFDVVLGNPPWDVIQEDSDVDKNQNFAKTKNWFKETSFSILKGRRDLYKLFIVKSLQLCSNSGRAGFITPFGMFVESDSTDLRRRLFADGSVIELGHFQNHRKAFFNGLDSRYRFVKYLHSPMPTFSHSYSTVVRSPSDIGDEKWITSTKEELEIELGENYEAILYPNENYYSLHNDLVQRLKSVSLLSYHVIAEFHATTDKNKGLLKKTPVSKGDWRILKNRSIHQFDHQFSEPDLYIAQRNVVEKLQQKGLDESIWLESSRLLFRDIARNDDTRTLLSCIAPPGFVSSYDTPMIVPKYKSLETLNDTLFFTCGVLNTFIFDFLIRPFVDKHIKGYVLNRLPIPEYNNRVPIMKKICSLSKVIHKLFSNETIDESNRIKILESRAEIEIQVASLCYISFGEMKFIRNY